MRTSRLMYRILPISTVLAIGCAFFLPAGHADTAIQYNRDVLPILANNCFPCHGPDGNTRKRDIRFDLEEGLMGQTKGGLDIVVPGKPDESELYRRVAHPDVSDRMPPAQSKLELSAGQIQTLKTWIEQGAAWQGHWAFVPPEKPAVPEVSDASWCNNEIDNFILSRLDEAGLAPSAEADKETLIRRVSLDLTGLPPTPAEVDAFLEDTSDTAYEQLVDRLLASPHYGERMAFIWLDAARYADTNGYQRDTLRIMWPWRDWVINAYNTNMPFDEFAIEQLAGDLLPDATLDQKIATGFNRNHRINGEGGIIPEEYAVEYVADRVSTTSTVFMGLSMGCARCHDHKFDPLTQKEFYELYAFFDQVPEQGKGGERGNDEPFIAVPTPEETARKAELAAQLSDLESKLAAPDDRLDALQTAWENTLNAKFAELDWQTVSPSNVSSENGTTLTRLDDDTIIASGENPDTEVYTLTFDAPRALGAIKLDVFLDDSMPEGGPGRAENGNSMLTGFELFHGAAGAEGEGEQVPVIDALTDYSQSNGDYAVRNAIDADPASGWATGSFEKREARTAIFVLDETRGIIPGDRLTVKLKFQSPYQQHAYGRFRLSQSATGAISTWARQSLGAWHYLGPIYSDTPSQKLLDVALPPEEGYDPERVYGDNQVKWMEQPGWADGQVVLFEGKDEAAHYLHRTIEAAIPTKVTFSLGSNDAIKVWVDGLIKLNNNVGRVAAADQEQLTVFLDEGTHDILIKIVNYGGETGFYFRMVDDEGRALLSMMDLIATPVEQRSPDSQQRLRLAFRERDAEWIAANNKVEETRAELTALEKSITTTMVMADMETRRDTYLLLRGVYDKPDTSEKLYPSVPAALGEMDESLPKNRLGFARWLVSPEHPLTARVQVNHYWQNHFGRGLVKTSEDFGTQGVSPTHPQLLDWLAVTFVESGWDMKAMHKLMVMSATYRQKSQVVEPANEQDPANLLLSRAPRIRLAAEMVRDQALAASGLLNGKIGGPSVKPYQPDDMWSALTFQNMDEYDTNFYVQDTGDKLYRRGLYTYWKRTILPPRMQIFNAAGREMCSMRQENTNTPMQALVVLNDPTFVEAARHLAGRMVTEGGERSAARIRYGYRLLLARELNQNELQILLGALSDYQTHFIEHQDAAKELLGVGESEADVAIAEPELAAYTMLASVMLNTDKAITRE